MVQFVLCKKILEPVSIRSNSEDEQDEYEKYFKKSDEQTRNYSMADKSYCEESSVIIGVLPNGALVRYLSCLDNQPIGILDLKYVKDGNFTLKQIDKTIDQTKLANGLKKEFEKQVVISEFCAE